MSRIAVIGTGIAGLSAAWLLSRKHEVWVFEKETRIGGHTHTVTVDAPEGPVAVDTGFIVHNQVNYPNFLRLMDELAMDTCPSDMSFAASGNAHPWCSRGLNGLFTERRHLVDPGFFGLWAEVIRFNRTALTLLDSREAEGPTLGEYLARHGFSKRFKSEYLYPMAGAVWSTSLADMELFPAATLARFFHNHGFLGVTTHHPWRTIPGGTSRYLDPITRPFRERIVTGARINSVRRSEGAVHLYLEGQETRRFDQMVFACHGDQVLPLLADASPQEREVFSAFTSNLSPTVLHRDATLLPVHRRGWASWNFKAHGDGGRLVLTYHMNRLQPLGTKQDWFVSLHAEDLLDPAAIAGRYAYEHPRFTREAIRAQARWAEVSGPASLHGRTHYAGAYWGYGFHEDGVRSGIRVARDLGVTW
ncbi:MAG: FAD-dependent oxidoreductase [Geothrix sp.]|uniref:NAD(P)/FAD-dependent oxidoreductase n=1 Tax=Geothrix sp. TaxID=1962974 RepID=UPI00180F1885|nr:FAD-dependent oxidoreductase [Geothrix sp.]NWJ42115.1 FAD-dependent oxidoreductase [Geothrix sp.]WIL19918.1 MAG: FAD-dependent oxidoreductase [Geothrix sp.]